MGSAGTSFKARHLLRVAVWALLALAAAQLSLGVLMRWLFPSVSVWAEVLIDMALVVACTAPVLVWRLWMMARGDQVPKPPLLRQ